MAASIWQRIRESTQDVLSPAEKGRALMLRLLTWLALIGFTVGASLNADTLLPPSNLGRVVWGGAILAALILGIQAVYRLRTRVEMPPMAQPDFDAMIQMRQLTGRTVGMFGIEDGRFDPAGLEAAIAKLNDYRWTLGSYGRLSEAIRRYVIALEIVLAHPDSPDFKRVDVAEEHLYRICREYQAGYSLTGKEG
jgi:hypothetical protein